MNIARRNQPRRQTQHLGGVVTVTPIRSRQSDEDGAFSVSWHSSIVASGEIQIKRIHDLKYSVWFVSGDYAVREWEGDEHWEAAFQATIAHGKYKGVKVFDHVTGETLLASRVVGMEAV